MNIIYVLIPIGLVLLALGVWAFFWATGSGQYDDLDSPAWRILMDDDRRPPAARRDEGSGEAGSGDGDEPPVGR